MKPEITFAITGDSIINRRISVHTEERFLSLVKILREADVSYTHLETLIHDFDGPEIYPAAEAGWTWMRSPRFVSDELKWAGFDLVSLASNHAVDYSYGGLYSTWKALDDAGLVHAGTGKNLGEAREPAYLDTPKGRIALISMCSTFTGWAKAGEARRDVKGRPGLNPLRFYHTVDPNKLEIVKQFFFSLGWEILQSGKLWLFNPPGLQMAIWKFVEADENGLTTVVEEDDADGNLRSIRDAARQSDYVIAHLHSHEFQPEKGQSVPPDFVQPFARACINAGANIFVCQGSHTPLRGIEIYKGRPIFYDPGDFMGMSDTVKKLPADFYFRPGYGPEARSWQATPADAFDAKSSLPKKLNPPGGNYSGRVVGSVVAICSLSEDGMLTKLKLHPVNLTGGKPRSKKGLPMLANSEMAGKIITHLGELSAPFGTKITYRNGCGLVDL